MKETRALTRHFWQWMWKAFFIISAAAVIVQGVFLAFGAKDLYGAAAYEVAFDGKPPVFLIAALVFLALFIYRLRGFRGKNAGIYTMLGLPAPWWALPLAEAVFAAAAVLWFCALQNLTAALWYLPYCNLAGSVAQEAAQELGLGVISVRRDNGLYLAFLRSEYLRVTLPTGLRHLTALLALPFYGAALTLNLANPRRGDVIAGLIAVPALLWLQITGGGVILYNLLWKGRFALLWPVVTVLTAGVLYLLLRGAFRAFKTRDF